MTPIKVLLIENNENDADLARRPLRKESNPPFDVDWVKDLSTGLERIARGGIDVIVLDLGLPDSKGLESFTRIQAQASDLPIIILTGSYRDDALALQALKQGAQDYLMKGELDGKMLVRVIRYAIERKQIQVKLLEMTRQLQMQLDQVAWLQRIMMDREKEIIELKESIEALTKELNGR